MTKRIESRLLVFAASFLFIYCLALSLSPAARARSWEVVFLWSHWAGFLSWAVVFWFAHHQCSRWLPDRDPYLLPIAGLLSGWGILTIWRLLPGFGARQSVWLLVGMGVLIAGLRLPSTLGFLRKYKYLWLTGSLLLTGLTFFLGTNPMGDGPRMWLGCCGVYLQPSEPLKLLLIAYLAAHLAERYPYWALSAKTLPLGGEKKPGRLAHLLAQSPVPLLAPTFIMTGLAMALLLMQRDLGTATVFLLLFAVMVYISTGQKAVLAATGIFVGLAGLVGYRLLDVVRVRVDAWVNPWLDPSGGSYQIVQSLIAIANGGFMGRGPGMGNPGLVPVAHSDLIFAAIAEEHGLLGVMGLFILLAMLAVRGLRAAENAADAYRRYLAAGLTAYLVGQGLMIIGGSLRLLPLTGITLPFVSYGGSSLLTSMLSLLLLLHISQKNDSISTAIPNAQVYHRLGALFLGGVAVAALAAGWWAIYRGPDLLTRTDNPRRSIDDRSVRRGSILDRGDEPINLTQGEPGSYIRRTLFPDLSNVTGYTDPTYGQFGLEASLDGYLRGLQGNTGLNIWWNHLFYGQPPPGSDVRLSLDLTLQAAAHQWMQGQRGALVLLNAGTGEILVMASHPTFDANQLAEQWSGLIQDENAPLLNRAVLGLYPVDELEGRLLPVELASEEFGRVPQIRLPLGAPADIEAEFPGFSPLQVALVAATISSGGTRPAALLVTAVNTSISGWVLLPALETERRVISLERAQAVANSLALDALGIWQITAAPQSALGVAVTWYVGGSLPSWGGEPFALAILLEVDDPQRAIQIGQAMLQMVMFP
ncbi:MAG: FtsW/RodA/SpoVE family cell cycle protein [Anaerolineales bacterium]|nr:FtsW/RodA/SpoVE family cell cycle protein [Anaerolineales bacterium]